ncbi:uncharacterized protein TrAtP1_000617 [Trichoderma atroviride]|uniref:uncharacterized protein n=1 Tax=Hypocrea atroviridis TaxID=63577 RepID=UPI00331E6F79|nr:hypothetical protein TrAtP1_000617 [Trichoderma atroviride]
MAAVQPSMPAPATGSASTATSVSASDDTKDAVAKPGAAEIPVRTKESFDRLMVERYTMRDSIAASALSQQLNQTMKSSHEMREMITEYRNVRNGYQQWFPPQQIIRRRLQRVCQWIYREPRPLPSRVSVTEASPRPPNNPALEI